MILSFAFAGLFLVGNNLMADNTVEHGDFPGIICAQSPRVGGTCWECNSSSVGPCVWTGSMSDVCCQMA